MSFLADKKRDHEAKAEAALAEKDYDKAFFHTAKAAEFGFLLADQLGEQDEDKVASRYVEDAFELLDIAERLKAKTNELREERRKPKEGKPAKVERKEKPPVRPARVARKVSDEDEEPKSTFLLQEKPDIRLDDVAGLEDVKQVLREKVILPFQKPEVFERFRAETGAGVLMYGPPGNGKTFIAKAVAGEIDASFFPVNLNEMKSKYVGETAKNLTRLFEESRSHERAVLFLDECESLLGKRGSRKVDSVSQFLALTDGLQEGSNCMLILAATNKPWVLDEAVVRPGRLGTHVHVGLPDATARAEIIRYHMRGVPGSEGLPYDEIGAKTESYSGADMAAVCDRVKHVGIQRQLDSGKDEIVQAEDFDGALEKVRPSVTREQAAEYERWRDARDKPPGADDDD